MDRPIFQLRVKLTEQQQAALQNLYGADGSQHPLEPRTPQELCEALKNAGQDQRPVVVLNHKPMPADAMEEGLADFVTFGSPDSLSPLLIKKISVEVQNLISDEISTLVFPAR